MKTALTELIEWMDTYDKNGYPSSFSIRNKLTELLEKEREVAQEYARFAIECDRKGMPLLEFKDWVKL
jgi:hypothetical protein